MDKHEYSSQFISINTVGWLTTAIIPVKMIELVWGKSYWIPSYLVCDLLTLHDLLGSFHIRPISLDMDPSEKKTETRGPTFATTSDFVLAYAMPWRKISPLWHGADPRQSDNQSRRLLIQCCSPKKQSSYRSLELKVKILHQADLSWRTHWLVVERKTLKGLQRVGSSWHLETSELRFWLRRSTLKRGVRKDHHQQQQQQQQEEAQLEPPWRWSKPGWQQNPALRHVWIP